MTNQQKNYIWGAIGLVIIIGLVFLGQASRDTNGDKKPIKVGVMAALSGPLASLGGGALHGLELGIKEINEGGGVGGRPIELVIEDTKGDAKEGINVFNKLTNVDGLKIVLQLFVSRVEVPLVPIAKEKDVFFLAHSFHPALANNTPHVWRHSATMEDEAAALATFLTEKNYKTVGIIAINDDYGIELARQVRMSVEKIGGSITIEERHETNASDFRAIITKTTSTKPDVLFVSSAGTLSGLLLKQIRELGYQGTVVASGGVVVTPDALKAAGDAKKGMYFNDLAIMYTDKFIPFDKKYRATYNEDTPRAAAITYGSAELLADLLREAGESPDALAKALAGKKTFEGSLETMTILPNGNITTPIVVKQF